MAHLYNYFKTVFPHADVVTSELKDQKEKLCRFLSANLGGIFQLPF